MRHKKGLVASALTAWLALAGQVGAATAAPEPAATMAGATTAQTAASHGGAPPAHEVYADSDGRYTQSLDGNWSFKYLPRLDAGADEQFSDPAYDVSGWTSIPVPANWELQGHAEPHYGDDLQDGLGLYRRTFATPAQWQGRRSYLRFDGVAFGYEVWLNGKKVGASNASAFNRHTFDVTDFLRPGGAENVLAVRVSTKPRAYEFDLNDDWSLSGIYREVTLLSLPEAHVQDIATRTTLRTSGAGQDAQLSLSVQLRQAKADVYARLLGPDGNTVVRRQRLQVAGADAGGRHGATLEIAKAQLWTAETPALYRLVLDVVSGGKTVQTVEQTLGLREVRVDGKRLLVNGTAVKLRGVNHHDLDPLTGRAVTEAQIRHDLALLKQANVNYLRTSHYPPHPRLLALCDELGFYVMDEVAIGHGEQHLDDPAYRADILARARATIARDKHHASVLIWSIGNENPLSEAEFEAGRLVKQLDPTRPITYPKIGSYFARHYERIPAFVDLYSPHYPTNATLRGYADQLTRPTILTEYAHALGLASDRIQDQWDILQANPVFAGGSIWHFHDQGLLRRSATPVDTSQPTQFAWKDARQFYDTHGLDGADGLVYADRTPQTDYWQMRKVYAPVQFPDRTAPVRDGSQQVALTVENRHDFRSLRGVQLHWALQQNGAILQQGQQALSAAPQGRETMALTVDVPALRTPYADVLTLELRAVDEHGLQINERSVQLLRQDLSVSERMRTGASATLAAAANGNRAMDVPAGPATTAGSAPQLHETAEAVSVDTSAWRLTVQRASGALEISDAAGRVLVQGLYPHSGRQLTMAEKLGAPKSGVWGRAILERPDAPVVKATRQGNTVRVFVQGVYRLPAPAASTVTAAASNAANAGAKPPAAADDLLPTAAPQAAVQAQGYSGGYELDIDAGTGTDANAPVLRVRYAYQPIGGHGVVAEAGLSVMLPAGFDELRWIGQGPYAGYPGKDRLNEFGIYHLHRADLRFQGNRRGTELALLTDAAGTGVALASTPADVAVERHGARTLLSHNALIGGLGNKGTQPETIVALKDHGQIAGSFTLQPLTGPWSPALQSWFGAPRAAQHVLRPFYHSYDQ